MKNMASAVRYYKKAASHNHKEAMEELASACGEGGEYYESCKQKVLKRLV